MKIFLDSSDIESIRRAVSTGVIDGVTTNPTLIAKAVQQDPTKNRDQFVQEIASIVNGPVSAEVLSTTTDEMLEEGRALATLHEHIVVKLPIIEAALPVIKQLTSEGIRVNVTLVFSLNQALLAAKAGATYVSPFVGRLDDAGEDGVELVGSIVHMFKMYGFDTQVLAASMRNANHVAQVAEMGSDIATLPIAVFDEMIKHPLTDSGLETFLKDAQSHA